MEGISKVGITHGEYLAGSQKLKGIPVPIPWLISSKSVYPGKKGTLSGREVFRHLKMAILV